MKAIFVGPKGICAGSRFGTFVFLLFCFSKLFFWFLTTLFHYQEHTGWVATDFLLDGALSFGAALLAVWIDCAADVPSATAPLCRPLRPF